jgi:LPS-assembly protein
MKPAARHIAATALGALLLALPAGAQDATTPPATLIADTISFTQGDQVISAEGGVEIFYQGARLRAASVIYDGAADRVQVTGPITLTEETGSSIIFAEFADLSTDLQEGVLRSARLVLDRQLQIAATEIERSEGRYTQLYQGVASSCEVCFGNPVPLWEIRARRIVHDQLERQLYFDGASFRVMGLPIAYFPQLRLPGPTLERATGVLTPSLRANAETGTHLRLPYFITLGRSADVTLTPWIGLGDTHTVEFRYRQAFRTGEMAFVGAYTNDDLTDEDVRGYLFGEGLFALPRDFLLKFAIQGTTDRGYLTTYGFPDPDILESFVGISRTSRDEFIGFDAIIYSSQRNGDDNETLPNNILQGEYISRFVPGALGGIATMGLDGSGYYRDSNVDGPDGRDVASLSAFIDWRRNTVLPGGVLLAVESALYADIYNTWQDVAFPDTTTRAAPFVGVELRYPLARTAPGGVTHLLEPVVQLVWSDIYGGEVPDEDSLIVEFDEANLFALDRFPGQDRRETGLRANIGVGYTRIDPLGWSLGVTGGVVLRQEDEGQFTTGSGLNGTQSDFLLATYFTSGNNWDVFNRAIFDDSFTFTSNELLLGWSGDRHLLKTSYTWLEADTAEGRPRDIGEWALAAEYEIDAGWIAAAAWRYDFVEAAPTRAGLSLGYGNECVDMEFSVARRYTSSATVSPATEFGMTVSLNGFGAQRSGRGYTRSCLR